tara:strand:+ start:1858 stop:3030 length:1173 start_codon:yes stop_codon:yes gene_type:complete
MLEPGAVLTEQSRRKKIHKFLTSDRTPRNISNFAVSRLTSKNVASLNPQVRELLRGRSRNTTQRFDISKLAFNPIGDEANWKPVNKNPNPMKNEAKRKNGAKNTTILYHASKDKALITAATGSVLRTEGPTWHHTRHSWDYFERKRRVIAEIHVPSAILVNAMKLQNTTSGNTTDRIKQAKFRQLLNEKATPGVFTGNRPLITSFGVTPRLTPYGLGNGKSYATVVMPPFYARIVDRRRSNDTTKPDRVKMVFLKFVSASNRSLGKLINPGAANQHLFMMDKADNNLRNKIRQNYVTLMNHMAAAPKNLTTERITRMLNNLSKFDPNIPVSELKEQLPQNLQHMIEYGYIGFGSKYSDLKLRTFIAQLQHLLKMRGDITAFLSNIANTRA